MTVSPGGGPASHGQAGFTTIEVMIAMLILIVGVLGTRARP